MQRPFSVERLRRWGGKQATASMSLSWLISFPPRRYWRTHSFDHLKCSFSAQSSSFSQPTSLSHTAIWWEDLLTWIFDWIPTPIQEQDIRPLLIDSPQILVHPPNYIYDCFWRPISLHNGHRRPRLYWSRDRLSYRSDNICTDKWSDTACSHGKGRRSKKTWVQTSAYGVVKPYHTNWAIFIWLDSWVQPEFHAANSQQCVNGCGIVVHYGTSYLTSLSPCYAQLALATSQFCLEKVSWIKPTYRCHFKPTWSTLTQFTPRPPSRHPRYYAVSWVPYYLSRVNDCTMI